MTSGRHPTKKSPKDITYSREWSGVSYAPSARGRSCAHCGGHVHREGDSYYCPYCDDYVSTIQSTTKKKPAAKKRR